MNLSTLQTCPGSWYVPNDALGIGLIGAWECNEGNGPFVLDHSGLDQRGEFYNLALGTSWTLRENGYALTLPGNTSYYVRAACSRWVQQLGNSGTPFTVSAHCYFTQLAGKTRLLAHVGTGTTYGWALKVSSTGTMQLLIASSGPRATAITSSTVSLNQWYNITGTYNGTECEIYLDGIQQPLGTDTQGSGTTGVSATTVKFGDQFAGYILNTRIWNRVLAPAEIALNASDPDAVWRRPQPAWLWRIGSLSVSLADSVTVSDALTATVYAATIELADSMTLTDALAIVADYNTTLADSLSLADAITTTYAGALVLADNIGFADAGLFAAAYTMALADGFTLSDAISFAQAVYLADAIGVSDALTQTVGAYAQALADGLSMADALTISGAYSITLADGMTLADAITATTSTASLLRDTLNILATLHTLDIAAVRTTLDILKTRHTLGVDTDE